MCPAILLNFIHGRVIRQLEANFGMVEASRSRQTRGGGQVAEGRRLTIARGHERAPLTIVCTNHNQLGDGHSG